MTQTPTPSPTTPPRRVVVLGAGTWGLGLGKILWEKGHDVRLWDFYPEVIEKLRRDRSHPRLGGLRVPDSVGMSADLIEAVRDREVAVLVTPSTAIRSTCEAIKAAGLDASIQRWVLCSKGLEPDTLILLSDVILEALGADAAPRVCALTGPSHAEEVARGLPTAVVAASQNPDCAKDVQSIFMRPHFRVYTSDDLIGAELGGALKNVIAIAAGISDGMGFGDNTRAGLITRSLVEMTRLGVAMGARAETFMGLSGIGDLIVTATSVHSRNHQFGELLARGLTCYEALKEVGMVVEGYTTVKAAKALSERHGVEMPIVDATHMIIYEGVPAREALEALLSREAKPER